MKWNKDEGRARELRNQEEIKGIEGRIKQKEIKDVNIIIWKIKFDFYRLN